MRDENARVREKFELSLDGRQIASIVVGALVILGVVFVLGLNVGRQVATRQASAARAGDLEALDRGPTAAVPPMDGASLTFHDRLVKQKPPTQPPVTAVAAAGASADVDRATPAATTTSAGPTTPSVATRVSGGASQGPPPRPDFTRPVIPSVATPRQRRSEVEGPRPRSPLRRRLGPSPSRSAPRRSAPRPTASPPATVRCARASRRRTCRGRGAGTACAWGASTRARPPSATVMTSRGKPGWRGTSPRAASYSRIP